MATETWPTEFPYTSASLPILGVCLVLSFIVHLITARGISSYAASSAGFDTTTIREITIPDMPVPPQPREQELKLGREDAKSASITWLGVLENPTEGEAPESEVEQAELAINTGVQEVSQPSPAQPTPPVESTPEQNTEPAQISKEPEAPAVEEVADELEPVTESESEPETVEQPEQSTVIDLVESDVEPVIETSQSEQIDPDPQPEPVEEPTPAQITPEPPVEQTDELVENKPEVEPEAPPEQPDQVTSQTPEPEQATTNAVTAQGKPGEEDDRESVASMIKRARTHKVSDLNRPLSSAGLEIKPVEPRYPATVRFTQLPRNPIVIIRINAAGRVIFTDFIRDEEKKRVYDTGSRTVDEPLLSAIYKWRATGKQLKELDADDPKSFIEITMKIIFRDEED